MAGRLSNVRQARKLNKQLDFYINTYLPKSLAGNVKRGKNKHSARKIQVAIFPFTLATGGKPVIVMASEAAVTTLNPLSGDINADKTISEAAELRPGFVPAKIVAFRSTGTSTTPKSGVTGVEYTKYAGESFTCPFGKKGTGDANTMWSAFAKIKKDMDSKLGLYGNVSMKPETFKRV